MHKPQVGISSVWYEGNTCNMHLLKLAEAVKEGVQKAGMVGFRFNTIGVSDAISMGTRGMCYSLQSRDLIADSIETVMAAQWYDGNISIPGCDKNVKPICRTYLDPICCSNFDVNMSTIKIFLVFHEGFDWLWDFFPFFVLTRMFAFCSIVDLVVIDINHEGKRCELFMHLMWYFLN